MNLFVLNLFLALIWFLLSESSQVHTFGIGFILGFILLIILRPVFEKTHYIKKNFYKNSDYIKRSVSFFVFLFWFIPVFLKANFTILFAVLFTKTKDITPHLFELDVTELSTLEIVILSQCITLTPGTTTVKVSEDQNTLIVHAFDGKETKEERDSIQNHLIPKIKGFTR